MRRIMKWMAAGIVLACAALAPAAEADSEDLKTTVEALKARLKDQSNRLAELENQQASQNASLAKIAKDMADSAANKPAGPGWLENLKFAGDLRLRYQGDFANWGSTAGSEKKDRHRARFRVRAGVTKTWLDEQIEIGFRLATGESDDPTSTNQSFTGNFSEKPVWIDLAYARYAPNACKGFSITGGKMKNPWLMNEIFMDSDVNPEGFWAEYKAPKLGPVEPFAGAGYFILRESSSAFDTTMYGVQGGLKWGIAKDIKYTVAGYWQDYDHYDTSGASARGNDSPLTSVPGFGIVGLTNALEFLAMGLPVSLSFDWAHNCGEEDPTPDYENANNAYYAGVKLGKNKKKGDWSIKYCYAYVQANSLPGYFVDSDFGHSNRQGHVLRGEYNLQDNLTVGANLLLTEPIFSPTTTSGSSAFEDRTVTVQADLVWKF